MSDVTRQCGDDDSPIQTPTWALDELLERMAVETFPDVVGAGPPVGQEVW